MQSPNNEIRPDVRLKISFPKSNEDHRLQLVEINGSIFAIVHSSLESEGPISLYCEDWSLVLLSSIKSKTNIVVSATNIICLNTIHSEEGLINLHASNRLVKFANLMTPPEKVYQIAEKGEFQFHDDPGACLFYSQLFHAIVTNVYTKNPDSILEAQQKFIMSLCVLAQKVGGETENLTLPKVLDIWNIPPVNT